MYYVYVLRDSRDKNLYIGYSNNLEQRLKQHQSANEYTGLIYYEAYQYEKDTRDRERKLKMYGSAWRALKKRLKTSINNA